MNQPKPEYRTTDHAYMREHYGRDQTSAQVAAQLGRTAAAIRMEASRHPELRPPRR